MKELNQRIALACICDMEGPWKFHGPGSIVLYNRKGQRLPELSLDWLHEIVGSLVGGNLAVYRGHLEQICGGPYSAIDATKEQRSEALLRTLGLWKEETE